MTESFFSTSSRQKNRSSSITFNPSYPTYNREKSLIFMLVFTSLFNPTLAQKLRGHDNPYPPHPAPKIVNRQNSVNNSRRVVDIISYFLPFTTDSLIEKFFNKIEMLSKPYWFRHTITFEYYYSFLVPVTREYERMHDIRDSEPYDVCNLVVQQVDCRRYHF